MTRANYRRLLEVADLVQRKADSAGAGQSRTSRRGDGRDRSLLDRFDETVTIPALRTVCRGLFQDGHYARAVEDAFKCLNNLVKEKSGLPGSNDGAGLMRTAFSAKSPILKLNSFPHQSEKSQNDEQQGYMDLFAGAMTGIRNPRAHEHELVDHPEVALEMLTLANHLLRKLKIAQNVPAQVENPSSSQPSSTTSTMKEGRRTDGETSD